MILIKALKLENGLSEGYKDKNKAFRVAKIPFKGKLRLRLVLKLP
jgi:hypothetical protein